MNNLKIIKSTKSISLFLLIVMFASLFTACTSGAYHSSANQKQMLNSSISDKMTNSVTSANSANKSLDALVQQMDNITSDLVQSDDSADANDSELVDLLSE